MIKPPKHHSQCSQHCVYAISKMQVSIWCDALVFNRVSYYANITLKNPDKKYQILAQLLKCKISIYM